MREVKSKIYCASVYPAFDEPIDFHRVYFADSYVGMMNKVKDDFARARRPVEPDPHGQRDQHILVQGSQVKFVIFEF